MLRNQALLYYPANLADSIPLLHIPQSGAIAAALPPRIHTFRCIVFRKQATILRGGKRPLARGAAKGHALADVETAQTVELA